MQRGQPNARPPSIATCRLQAPTLRQTQHPQQRRRSTGSRRLSAATITATAGATDLQQLARNEQRRERPGSLRRFTANWPEPPLLLLCRALRARGRGAAAGIGDGRLVALTAARDALPIPILLSDLVAVGIHPSVGGRGVICRRREGSGCRGGD